jgi:hypothetical protein
VKLLSFRGLRVNNADVYWFGKTGTVNQDLQVQLEPRTILQIHTQHHCYTAVFLGDNQALIWGHPEFCPRPVHVSIAGSTWGGTMLKVRFVGRGMRLEFHHPAYRTPIVTSPIREINERQPRCSQPVQQSIGSN